MVESRSRQPAAQSIGRFFLADSPHDRRNYVAFCTFLTLKEMATAAVARRQSSVVPHSDIRALESRLQSLHQGIVTNQYEAGAILTDLKQRFPHGQWGVYLRQLCQRINLSRRAADYYTETFAELQSAGGDAVVVAATAAGLNTNKKPVRSALVEVAKMNPHASPTKIAKFAKMKVAQRAFKNPAIEQLAELRKQFPNVLLERVGGSCKTSFQAWITVRASKAPKGQRVTVEMSSAQLRHVPGTVTVGANGLEYAGVRKFLRAWGVK